jgi:sporulation protein YlmC with PRC-barrel domain
MKLNHVMRKSHGASFFLSLSASGLLLAASAVSVAQNQQGVQQQQGAQDDGTEIIVDEQQPRVQVEQQPVEVIAEQGEMDVDVQSQEPEVSVQQPDPEVMVEQQEPEVVIQQSEPEVIVESAEPQVEIRQADPEVTVNTAEPEVRVITVDEQGQEQISQIDAQPMQGQQTQQAQAQQGQQTQVEQAGQQQTRDLMQLDVAELGEKTVVTSQGEELGSVEDVVIHPDQGRAGLVVSTGGILGIGGEQILVPAEETYMQQDQIVWETQQSAEQISEGAQYNEEEYTSVADAEGSLEEARNDAMQRAQR